MSICNEYAHINRDFTPLPAVSCLCSFGVLQELYHFITHHKLLWLTSNRHWQFFDYSDVLGNFIMGNLTFTKRGSVAKFDCIFALVQCCAILFVKKPKAGTIHDD